MGNTFYDRAESTELRGADLSGLDLSGADLSGACFRGAKLHGADFTDSIGGELAELRERVEALEDERDELESELVALDAELRERVEALEDERGELERTRADLKNARAAQAMAEAECRKLRAEITGAQ